MNEDQMRNADQMRVGVARLMVRRHLSDLIRPGIGTEDQIVEMFVLCMQASPDAPMKEVAAVFRMTVNRLAFERAATSAEPSYRTVEN